MFLRWILPCLAVLFVTGQFGSCQRWSSSSEIPLEYEYDYFHTDVDEERRLAYFREDPSLALLNVGYSYSDPFWVTTQDAPVDRSGELWHYTHSQLLARYDAERISNGLPLTIPIKNLYEPICEGYFPDFPPYSTKYTYFARPESMPLKDVPVINHYVKIVAEWWKKLEEAVDMGHIIHHNGTRIPIYGTPDGLELLVHTAISKAGAPNHQCYGCYYTALQQLIASATNPVNKYFTHFDLIYGFVIPTMDPAYYTSLKQVTNLINRYKSKLTPYTEKDLSWNGIRLRSIDLYGDETLVTNELTTFTQEWRLTLKHGYDMLTDQPISVLHHILNHEEFCINIEMENLCQRKVQATVRILLAPTETANGEPIPLEVQRTLFIELDKFKVLLSPGVHHITHHSTHPWVTIPLETCAERLENMPKMDDPHYVPRCHWPDSLFNQSTEQQVLSTDYNLPLSQEEANNICGWPQHLNIPRGNSTGVNFALFVMLTNFDVDKVRAKPEQDFNDASAYCGIYNDKYPDRRAMGFPFDRPFKKGATLQSILYPNMGFANIKIFHSDVVVPLGGKFTV